MKEAEGKPSQGIFRSPTHGDVDTDQMQSIISTFMETDKNGKYEIIVGSDSQKVKKGAGDSYDFVSAIIIHRVGHGGIYLWKREERNETIPLKKRMYLEAAMSLETAENFIELFKNNGISRLDVQIHVDIGPNGETREVINEVVGMIRGSGYEVKIKPDSFGASKVADRHT